LQLAAGGSVGSADSGTPTLTFATNKGTFNQPLYLGTASNQLVTGTSTNLTTSTYPASSGAVTLTFPNTTEYMVGANSDTTTTHVAHATAVAGVANFAAIAAADLPAALSSSTSINKVTVTAPTTSATLTVADGTTLSNTYTMNAAKTAGVAGAIPWYDTTTSESASALLTQYGVMIGGGASAAPSTIAASTTTTQALFATATAPAFRAIAAGDIPSAAMPVVTTTVSSGTIGTVTTNNTYVICTTTCNLTPMQAAAGVQLCVRNAPGSATVITLNALASSNYYELTTHAGWGTAAHNLVSGGVATDSICLVGYDATHYAVMSFTGTWTD
jgi:hypothetical protein